MRRVTAATRLTMVWLGRLFDWKEVEGSANCSSIVERKLVTHSNVNPQARVVPILLSGTLVLTAHAPHMHSLQNEIAENYPTG
jgi:hypothetical protein